MISPRPRLPLVSAKWGDVALRDPLAPFWLAPRVMRAGPFADAPTYRCLRRSPDVLVHHALSAFSTETKHTSPDVTFLLVHFCSDPLKMCKLAFRLSLCFDVVFVRSVALDTILPPPLAS